MATLFSLDCLARFAPQIFGRALSLDGVFGTLVAGSGRHDHIDAHTFEMRCALQALALLSQLAKGEPTTERRAAQVLAYTHVVCGEEARQQPDTWLSLGLQVYAPKKLNGRPLPPEQAIKYRSLGLRLYGDAKALWGRL